MIIGIALQMATCILLQESNLAKLTRSSGHLYYVSLDDNKVKPAIVVVSTMSLYP
jgi:hypothetical protein